MRNKSQNNPKQPNGIVWVHFLQFCSFLTQWDMKNEKILKNALKPAKIGKNEKNNNPMAPIGLQI